MATKWFNPRQIVQYAEDGAETVHVRWDNSNGFADLKGTYGSSVGTLGNLEHHARSPKPDTGNKTFYLKLTEFRLIDLPLNISGIELKLESRRAGRVTDETVSLVYNDNFLGDNQASLEINPIKYYGGVTELWGVPEISAEILQDASFGVVLRFKSHPGYPHRDPMDLVSVQLRIH